jgi:hypothetical protein
VNPYQSAGFKKGSVANQVKVNPLLEEMEKDPLLGPMEGVNIDKDAYVS